MTEATTTIQSPLFRIDPRNDRWIINPEFGNMDARRDTANKVINTINALRFEFEMSSTGIDRATQLPCSLVEDLSNREYWNGLAQKEKLAAIDGAYSIYQIFRFIHRKSA